MKLEKELPADLDAPGVPEIIRQHLTRKLRGPAVRVKVEAERMGKAFTSINAIRLADRGAANSSPDVDAVAELLTKIIHAYHVEHESEDDYLPRYRVTCELRNEKSRTPLSEKSFSIRYTPGQDSEDSDVLRENDILSQALEVNRETISMQQTMIDDLHQVVLSFAHHMGEPIRASAEISHAATSQWIAGANMLVQGHKQLYDIGAATEAEKGRTARVNALLMKFGGTIDHLSTGLIDFIYDKIGKKAPGTGITAQIKNKMTAQPAAAAQPAEGGAQEGGAQPAEGEGAEPAVDEDKVFAVVIEAFARSITPKQRKEMNTHLTKKQLAKLDELFCAENNNEVADHWVAVQEEMGLEKLMWMGSMLDADQQNDFFKIKGWIEKFIAKRASEEGGAK